MGLAIAKAIVEAHGDDPSDEPDRERVRVRLHDTGVIKMGLRSVISSNKLQIPRSLCELVMQAKLQIPRSLCELVMQAKLQIPRSLCELVMTSKTADPSLALRTRDDKQNCRIPRSLCDS